MSFSKPRTDQEIASEYRFNYSKAKPNRFTEKMNLNVGWTVGKFVTEEEKESSRKVQSTSGKKKAGQSKKAAPAKKK